MRQRTSEPVGPESVNRARTLRRWRSVWEEVGFVAVERVGLASLVESPSRFFRAASSSARESFGNAGEYTPERSRRTTAYPFKRRSAGKSRVGRGKATGVSLPGVRLRGNRCTTRCEPAILVLPAFEVVTKTNAQRARDDSSGRASRRPSASTPQVAPQGPGNGD